MDRNSAIGLVLISALLLVYFLWFSPTPPPPSTQPVAQTETLTTDSLKTQKPMAIDSASLAKMGDLSAFATGTENETIVETEDLRVVFSNKGGILKEVELKKFKTYHQKPLVLIEPRASEFTLITNVKGEKLDLYKLYYETAQSKRGDTSLVSFTLRLADGTFLKHTYAIAPKGYSIPYTLESNAQGKLFNGETLAFHWNAFILPIEKDLADTRTNTTLSYYTDNDGFDELSARSNDPENESFAGPVKWVAIKEKFFLSSIIAKTNFSSGDIALSTNLSDSSVVKRAQLSLNIPMASGKAAFDYYIGPNDYKDLQTIAPEFKKNVYLGWPPVYWINKFVIFPVFHFLTNHITNYGLIIVVLVLLLKLVLLPLSYKSYLSMAKMKVLKPELDEIKERVGEDMTKVQQEQMKLYQQVGVNPLSGCVPVLLQMPILFAMFYLFPASIELRQQPFLWAEDLSTYDSIISFSFAIPFLGSHISLFTVLMTASTLIYTWQNNQLTSVQGPMKSMQYIMPLVFFFVLNSFSAGLTFYYFVSNLVTFGQQALIKRFVDEKKIRAIMDENRKRIAAGGGKKSKFMAKLEEAMKASEESRKSSESKKKGGNK